MDHEPARKPGNLSNALQFGLSHAGGLAAIVLFVNVPFYVGLAALRLGAGVAAEDATAVLSVLSVALFPLEVGAMVYALNLWYSDSAKCGTGKTLSLAFRAGLAAWRRIVVAYLSASLVVLGYVAVSCIPGGLFMLATGWHSPYVLVPFALPAVMLVARYVFLDSVVVLEGLSPYEARHRSAFLAKPYMRRIVGFALLLMSLPFALEAAGEFLIPKDGAMKSPVMGLVLETFLGLSSALLYIVPTVFFFCMYKDLTAEGGLSGELERADRK